MPPRCLPHASRMPPPWCLLLNASQMTSCSPLTLDVSKVPSARFRGQSIFSIFYVLGNDGRNPCKMLLKKNFQWRHKCAKCGQIVKRSMKIKGPNNLRMEMTKQGETQALQSLIFEYHPTQNRSFNFSTFVPNVFQMALKGIRNWGLWVPLAQKTGRREVYKTRQKTSIRKVRQYVKNVPKKGLPEKWSFCCFLGSGAKGVPGWSQRPPRAPYKVKSCRKFDKKWCAELDFCDVLLDLVPDWTHMPQSASARLPAVPGRFQSSHPCNLQRAT